MLTIMKQQVYSSQRAHTVQAFCQDYFELAIPVDMVFDDDIETSASSLCTLFTATTGQMYALFVSRESQSLADVRHHARAMGLGIDSYAFPFGDRRYFERKGFEIFKRAYPGRKTWTPQEASYYRTLVAYNPALVRVTNIRDGIRRYNPNYATKWQHALDVRYNGKKVMLA